MDIDLPAAEPTPGAGDGEGEVTPQASDSETESTDDEESEQQTTSQPAPPVDGDAIGNPDAEISVTGGNNSFADEDYDETESITQEAFNQALETLIDDNAKEWVYLTLPKVDL